MTTPEPTVQVIQYAVCALPEEIEDRGLFEVRVEWRGRGLWAVARHQQCLSSSGEWDWEMRPSEREDEWLAEHRFDEETAIKLAKEASLRISVNGWTVEKVLAREAASHG